MNLWMFPGQPLQFAQHLPDDSDGHAIASLCKNHCGYDLVRQQPVSGTCLSHHTCLQMYGAAMSLYRARQLSNDGFRPDLITEHSLGIYAALVVCGSISEKGALELVRRHGMCMYRMSLQKEYALGCPIGLQVEAVEAAARNNGAFVVNYNTSRHFLISGQKTAVEAALAECQAAGAFSVSSYPCEAPLHTPLMAEVEPELAAIVEEYRFAEPQVPLVESLNQTRLTAAAIPTFLVQALLQPVYWERTWKQLTAAGVTRGTEVGSGKALSKFNRWIDAEYE